MSKKSKKKKKIRMSTAAIVISTLCVNIQTNVEKLYINNQHDETDIIMAFKALVWCLIHSQGETILAKNYTASALKIPFYSSTLGHLNSLPYLCYDF